ncbi:hypothetical protein ZEAMMB73_Zm00001d012013 [Zea mays]|uniref:Uncharacterized protein n=1 Tax=Zea mays TaxID=4577 RepID=A0A1D6G5U3_MAIZE|nr:hypothetical protein ZEAMMB73_Zm00001d012013 [Zea mays]
MIVAAAAPAPPVPAPPGKPPFPLSSFSLRRRLWFSNGNAHGRDSATAATSSRATRRWWWSDPGGSREDYGSSSLEEEEDENGCFGKLPKYHQDPTTEELAKTLDCWPSMNYYITSCRFLCHGNLTDVTPFSL